MRLIFFFFYVISFVISILHFCIFIPLYLCTFKKTKTISIYSSETSFIFIMPFESPSSDSSSLVTSSTKPTRKRRTSSPLNSSTTPVPRKKGSRSSTKPKLTFQCNACAAVFKRSEHLVRHYRSRMFIAFVHVILLLL